MKNTFRVLVLFLVGVGALGAADTASFQARLRSEANHEFTKNLTAEAIGGPGLALRWLDPAVPLARLAQNKSAEVVDDLVSKKIVFRGGADTCAMFNYRDAGPCGRFTRDYQAAQLWASEEKPHHCHVDENTLAMLAQAGTVLLSDGGYLRNCFFKGQRLTLVTVLCPITATRCHAGTRH